MKDFASEAWEIAEKLFPTPLHRKETFECGKCHEANTYSTTQMTHETASSMIFLGNINSNIVTTTEATITTNCWFAWTLIKKHLNPRKLWSLKGASWNFCPHIRDIREMLSKGRHQEFDTILISCGVNDIDYMSGTEIHEEQMTWIKSWQIFSIYEFLEK